MGSWGKNIKLNLKGREENEIINISAEINELENKKLIEKQKTKPEICSSERPIKLISLQPDRPQKRERKHTLLLSETQE